MRDHEIWSYPHFGSLTYVFESLMNELGVKYIVPAKPSKRTIELGARYAPEFVCTPFKLTLGTFIEMLDRGANTLGMGGCNSYCRFGYYWPVQKLILEDLGSTNGTFVGKERVLKGVSLDPDTFFRVGATLLRIKPFISETLPE